MIRPLIYCETITQLESSILTIDSRIEELLTLRQQYLAAHEALRSAEDLTSTVEDRPAPSERAKTSVSI
ncbi:hypothetical protein [Sphingobacterium griseoflavum]|uniref:hypothetical protein n=1 Tax=Sphingobacterium griseoflavum TaxID=1474952 RepID=UPI001672AE93|nr:hypothetical protein [Sphingobacterium griseoflavum]